MTPGVIGIGWSFEHLQCCRCGKMVGDTNGYDVAAKFIKNHGTECVSEEEYIMRKALGEIDCQGENYLKQYLWEEDHNVKW